MTFRSTPVRLLAAAALLLVGACANEPVKPGGGTGVAGTTGTAGTGVAGNGTATGAAGNGTVTGAAGSGTVTGAAGTGAAGNGTTTGAAGNGTVTGAAGTGAAGAADGGAGAGGNGTATGVAGSGDPGDPPEVRPINVVPGGKSQIGQLRVDKSKPIIGKLILLLGGICGGTGAGGIESFIEQYGFHIFSPSTQTCVNTAPQKYKDIIANAASTPAQIDDANRQVGDARMELWDGVDRVDWVTVGKGASIVEETVAALKQGMTQDPGADYGYFLNADGTLRTTDVWVVGYSWGSQTWGMISSYVRFGRVICTSGPQAEGFPNGAWITHPSATPNDRKYTLLGFNANYPSMDKLDTAPNTVTSMIDTTTKAGWLGPPINVHPGDAGPFAPGHQIAMVGSDMNSPGGHTVFCTNNAKNGWIPLCKYAFNVQ